MLYFSNQTEKYSNGGNTEMALWNKKHTLLSAVDDWVGRKVINPNVADVLRLDINENIKTRSFAYIPILLGIICLAFGFVTFVAANWDYMSSMARVVLLIGSLLASWFIAIYLMVRGPNWAAQLFVLLACSIFGASIMLIAQIYHIQGEPKDAVWLWMAGTLLAAVLTRSAPALALSIGLITLWMLMDYNIFGISPDLSFEFLIYWLVCAFIAWWLASRYCAHLLMIGLVLWVMVSTQTASQFFVLNITLLLAFMGIALILCEVGLKKWLKGFEQTSISYLFLIVSYLQIFWFISTDHTFPKSPVESGIMNSDLLSWVLVLICICGIGFSLFAYWRNVDNKYDVAVATIFTCLTFILLSFFQTSLILIGVILLATQVWIIRMGWRLEYRPLSVAGFLGFALVMLIFYFETMGSLIDTSLFYFGAGLILVIGAIVLPKALKKWGAAS